MNKLCYTFSKMDYFQEQKNLKNKAEEILKDLDLVNHLQKYGEITFVGSYALDLMVKKDIDIVVTSGINYRNFLELVNYLFPKNNIYSLNLQDFSKSIYPNRPYGIYCGITYLVKPDIFWKIDVWFMTKDGNDANKLVDWVKSKLTDKNKEIILKIKNEMLNTKYGKEISGMDIYKAVLENKVIDLN
ncbi:MAG: hypothetical protein Q7R95_00960, partial [bacterium]|nr:hypothetical protein [bacterium]